MKNTKKSHDETKTYTVTRILNGKEMSLEDIIKYANEHLKDNILLNNIMSDTLE